jgi:hypothetical protein
MNDPVANPQQLICLNRSGNEKTSRFRQPSSAALVCRAANEASRVEKAEIGKDS